MDMMYSKSSTSRGRAPPRVVGQTGADRPCGWQSQLPLSPAKPYLAVVLWNCSERILTGASDSMISSRTRSTRIGGMGQITLWPML